MLDRPAGPSTLEFAPPETPEAAGPSIFPANMQLYFQPSEAEVAAAAETEEAAAAEAEAAVPATAPEGACSGWGVRERLLGGQHGCVLQLRDVALGSTLSYTGVLVTLHPQRSRGSPRQVTQPSLHTASASPLPICRSKHVSCHLHPPPALPTCRQLGTAVWGGGGCTRLLVPLDRGARLRRDGRRAGEQWVG